MKIKSDKVVGVTMGHPSGVGPEVIMRSLCGRELKTGSKVAIFGDAGVLSFAAGNIGCTSRFEKLKKSGKIGVVEVTTLKEKDSRPGVPSEAGSLAQVNYIKEAVNWILKGKISAIATAPISKAGMISAGYKFPGHTELMAELTGSKNVAMMFAGPKLKVVLATIHVPLCEVPILLNTDLILKKIRLAARAMSGLYGIKNPRIGVSALNPHGGEEGRMGMEESGIIAPAVKLARSEHIDASGPFPADTLFYRTISGEFDLVIAMYHDQAMIPVKTMGFGKHVNLTIGLPFIRTSPDHGTAFDLAPEFCANPLGMSRAIEEAAKLSARFPGGDIWKT